MRTTKKLLALSLAAAILPGCGGDDKDGRSVVETTQFQESKAQVGATALFDPAGGADFLPFPVDLLFSGTVDLTVNIPGKGNSFDPTDPGTLVDAIATPTPQELADPQTALNTITGFSTTAPMVARFSNNVGSPSGQNDGVRIFRLDGFDPSGSFGASVDRELVYGAEFVAGANGSSLLIIPTKPLESSTTHIVTIDGNLTSAGGDPVAADDTYRLLNGSFQLGAAIAALTAGTGDTRFLETAGGADCTLGVDCAVVNTADYQTVVDNAGALPGTPEEQAAIAAGAAAIVQTLAGLEAAADFASLTQLEALRRNTESQLTLLDGAGVDTSTLALSYSVTTQETVGPLIVARGVVQAAAAPSIEVLNPLPAWDLGDAAPFEVVSPGADGDPAAGNDFYSHIYLGNLNGALQFLDPATPNTGVWSADTGSWNSAGLGGACSLLPADATGTENLVPCNSFQAEVKAAASIPVLISAPRAEALAGGADLDGFLVPDCSGGNLPVVIFQHGITTSRATLLAIADALGSNCMVGVAIDLPKHGILPSNDPFGAEQIGQLQQALQQEPAFSGNDPVSPVLERLVKVANPMDQCQAGTGTPVLPADGDFYCPSADNYINLTNLANARDTARQGVVDLVSLYRALTVNGGTDLVGATIGTTIDTGNISFVGVSLGGIAGTPFLGVESGIQAAVLNVTSGNIAKLLDGSASFEPSITSGLYGAAGIAKPSGDYEGFLILAQALTDSADPINFTDLVKGNGTPILMQEVTGNGDAIGCIVDGDNCPDPTVPNNVFGTSFGPAWGAVDSVVVGLESPNIVAYQSSFLPGQNFLTTPVALAGSDALAQGTGFITLAGALQNDPVTFGPLVAATGQEDSNNVVSLVTSGVPAFTGLGLPEVGTCGAAGTSGLVRFISGGHGSLLSPADDPVTTLVMQSQMIGFIDNAGGVIPGTEFGLPEAAAVVRTNRGCP